MAQWHVKGVDYQVKFVHPKTHSEVYRGVKTAAVGDNVVVVFVAHDSVVKGELVDTLPQGEPFAIAKAAQRAVGDALTGRARIDFLRLVTQYPYGMEPGAIGLDGGGDPRANPNQADKASGGERINRGNLLQPGAFPDPQVPSVEPPTPEQVAASSELLRKSVFKPAWDYQQVTAPADFPTQHVSLDGGVDDLSREASEADAQERAAIVTHGNLFNPPQEGNVAQCEQKAGGDDGNPGEQSDAPNTEPAAPIPDAGQTGEGEEGPTPSAADGSSRRRPNG